MLEALDFIRVSRTFEQSSFTDSGTHQYVADPIDYVLSPEKLMISFFFFCGNSVGNINRTVRQG